MSIEILERAVARLEELKADAVQLPWSFTDQSSSMDGRNWLIRTDGVAGIKMSGHDYGYHNNVELIVTLSRTVDPLADILRTEVRRIIQNGGLREDQTHFNAVALAQAVLAVVSGE